MLTCLVPVLFIFYIQGVLKLKKSNSGAKGLMDWDGTEVRSFGICGGHSGILTGFSVNSSFTTIIITVPKVPTHFYSYTTGTTWLQKVSSL